MSTKRKHPRVSISYWVCCDCHSCLASQGGNFGFMWGFNRKGEAKAELAKYLQEHSERCFLAKETTEEVLPSKQPVSSKKRKVT